MSNAIKIDTARKLCAAADLLDLIDIDWFDEDTVSMARESAAFLRNGATAIDPPLALAKVLEIARGVWDSEASP